MSEIANTADQVSLDLAETNRKQPNPLVSILQPLASLRLAVGLLILAVFMIWVASLQQVDKDIWEIKKQHFLSPVVSIPLKTFFPEIWFPSTFKFFAETKPIGQWLGFQNPNPENSSIAILLPSGVTIIVAMLINLLAAHSLRFRIQTKGATLAAGLGITAMGFLLSYLVVSYGNLEAQAVAETKVIIDTLWYAIIAGLGVFGLALLYSAVRWYTASFNFSVLLIVSGALLILIAGYLVVTPDSQLNDSGMRILWQICQCSIASITLLAGCRLIFKRKAGMVLLHAGIILLLANEVWVTVAHKEQNIQGFEGTTLTYGFDTRSTDLAIIDRSEKENDKIVMIPSWKLEKNLNANVTKGKSAPPVLMEVPHTDLKIQVNAYYRNSIFPSADQIKSNPEVKPYLELKSSDGIGAIAAPVPTAVFNGFDSKVDTASALIVVYQSSGDENKKLGSFWATQARDDLKGPASNIPNVIKASDKNYAMTLWHQREYKNYDIHVHDVTATYYPGTSTPRHFGSTFQIEDCVTGDTSDHNIWMNNPLRYGDETFYQANYDKVGGREYTGFQVVWNRGWMIPYLCCAMVSIGMLAHFVPNMLQYVEKISIASPKVEPTGWLIPALICAGCFLVILGRERPKKPMIDDLDLSTFESIPVNFGGRYLPVGSLVRNSLRQTIGLESVKSSERSIFGGKKRHSATVFLAKLASGHSDAKTYPCLKVDNRDLLDRMKLQSHPGFRYTLQDVAPYNGKDIEKTNILQDDLRKALGKDKKKRTPYDNALIQFKTHHQIIETLQKSVGGVSSDLPLSKQLFETVTTPPETPGVIPGTKFDLRWLPLSEAFMKKKLVALAKESGGKNLFDLYISIIDEALYKKLSTISYKAEVNKAKTAENPKAELASILPADSPERLKKTKEIAKGIPLETRMNMVGRFIEQDPENGDPLFRRKVQLAITTLFGTENGAAPLDAIALSESQLKFTNNWQKVIEAIKNKDQEALDKSAAKITTLLKETFPEDEIDEALGRIQLETTFIKWQPTNLAKLLYIAAGILATLSTFFYRPVLHKSSFYVLALGFVIQSIALVLRLNISDNALITNIYTSAFAIGWGVGFSFLCMEWLTRRSISLILGGFLGFLALHVAYGLSTSGDTFEVLRAVLDTKFWLWTHVIIIAIGYLLTFLAGALGIAFGLKAIIGRSSRDEVRKEMNIVYGILCGATLASFIGTVLGGLWAEDSWGRFWGWDTKENGAAMIVLWNAAILHARWCGMIKFRGLIFMTAIGNMITCWSWFAVNELGIGLHSYGFTKGAFFWLCTFWTTQFILGLVAFLPCEALNRKSIVTAKKPTATT